MLNSSLIWSLDFLTIEQKGSQFQALALAWVHLPCYAEVMRHKMHQEYPINERWLFHQSFSNTTIA
ncbi:hypothetical protein DYP60_06345 [Sphaerochaeta halotolerans]|uniref:Uncharacterized protein n=1 Tax=Sphaerochaeta halotolerans TaxID=2293840 RepID=A0A372MHI3_9SPIR|nr:hypothetical protein DYP60_06345 [Sphaerochaeta halotolerans]